MSDKPIKKTVEAWEEETSKMLNVNELDNHDELTLEEFEAKAEQLGFLGVDYKARTEFLNDNGYELTRKNYLDTDLQVKPKDDEGKTE